MSHKLVSLYIGEGEYYARIDVDNVIKELEAERDEYRYNLSCARNEIHNMQIPMREDIKTITKLKAKINELEVDYKEACDRLQTANLIKDEQLAATRHQKYKRCLAMAKWCESERCKYPDAYGLISYKGLWLEKWHNRWLELAEKFKPNKEAK